MSQKTIASPEKTGPELDLPALLTFKVAEQVYGLPVTNVARIIEMVTITRLPDVPATIQGIINLQGKAVPVMDLRQRFGLPPKPYGLHTPIILTDIDGTGRMLGLVVDMVEDVLDVSPEHVEITETIVPTELAGQMTAQAGHLAGVAKVNRQMILILNMRALLNPSEQLKLSHVLGSEGRTNGEDGRKS
ncbi:MAG: chemotaxis protein CheW [Anaerolineae bacterium]|nr:chemotaxis protein CheW [Anaerolineae bacterium]